MSTNIAWEDFEKIDLRVGTIVSAELNPKAKKPSYRLEIDFGELGRKVSSAQITELYNYQELIGKQIVAVVNFPAKQIAQVRSECLVLGVVGASEGVVLLSPTQTVKNGLKIG
jgi:tRNA-binding protein